MSGTPETTREQRWAEAIRAARMTWTGGGDGDFDALLARTALALADAEAAAARAEAWHEGWNEAVGYMADGWYRNDVEEPSNPYRVVD